MEQDITGMPLKQNHNDVTSYRLRKITLGLILVIALILVSLLSYLFLPDFFYKSIILIVSGFICFVVILFTLITIRKEITQRIKLEYELRRLNNNKNKFFSIISHDLRGPVHGIAQLSAYLEDSAITKEEITSFGKAIKDTALSTGVLLEKLLLWTRVQTGNYKVKPEIIDIRQLTSSCITTLADFAAQKNVTINYKGERHMVVADKDTTVFVIKSTLDNAIKFSHENGVVTVLSVEAENKQIKITILDNGVGIAKERLDSLFQLDRMHAAKGTRGEKGAGLSLLLCKDFAELNDGKLSLDSQEGHGTAFHLSLPMAKK